VSSFERNDVPVAIENESAELRTADLGDNMTVAFMTLKKGADFGPVLAGLPDDMCQCPHWGYMLKGKLKMKTSNGDEVYEAGQAFYWPPGHSPEALEDTEYVDFSPTAEFNEVIRHIQSQG
jgi:hypothetical protein